MKIFHIIVFALCLSQVLTIFSMQEPKTDSTPKRTAVDTIDPSHPSNSHFRGETKKSPYQLKRTDTDTIDPKHPRTKKLSK